MSLRPFLVAAPAVWILLLIGASQAAETERVSVNNLGEAANAASTSPVSISADGRFVAFGCTANNLVDGDTNGTSDVFVRDMHTGTTTCVSRNSTGQIGNGSSSSPRISADGRFVAFSSSATNLVSQDNNFSTDVFVHDRFTQTTTRVSVSSAGVEGNSFSQAASISADGQLVAFQSFASNLAPGVPSNSGPNIFLHDRGAGETTWISQGIDGLGTNSRSPRISGDGSVVAFSTNSGNVTDSDTNGVYDVFLHVIATGITTRVSITSDGQEAHGNSGLVGFDVSADGRYVVFESYAPDLVANDQNDEEDVFLHDRDTGETRRVSVGPGGVEAGNYSSEPTISADGSYVVFSSLATNLVPEGHAFYVDIYAHELATGENEIITYPSLGTYTDSGSSAPAVSADGRFVVFTSTATNLVDGDTNGVRDVFRRDRGSPLPAQHRNVYVDAAAAPGGDGQSWDTAYKDLQAALKNALPGDRLRVAQGVYTPAPPGGSRTTSFRLRDHVSLWGGYAGVTAPDPDARSTMLYETVLSGDLDQNDSGTAFSDCCQDNAGGRGCDDLDCETAVCAIDSTCCTTFWSESCGNLAESICQDACGFNNDNSYHVVIATDAPSTTIIDGVTIRSGAAEGPHAGVNGWINREGGGLYSLRSDLRVSNCRLEGNWSRGAGGAMASVGGVGHVANCQFMDNAAGSAAGAIYTSGDPTIFNCAFASNVSHGSGGAIDISSGSHPRIELCMFALNQADVFGGAIQTRSGGPPLRACTFVDNHSRNSGGAVFLYSDETPSVLDSTFVGNSAGTDGGAISMIYGTPYLVGNAFFGNTSDRFGGGVYVDAPSSPAVHNCVFTGNVANFGGGLYQRSASSNVVVTHSTFVANTALGSGGGAYNFSVNGMTIANSIFWLNTAAGGTTETRQIYDANAEVTHTCIQGLSAFSGMVGNIALNPALADLAGPDGLIGTSDDDVRIDAGSPCIDAADSAAIPVDELDLDANGIVDEPMPFDALGRLRFWDDPATVDCPQQGAFCGFAPVADMGAFEFGATIPVRGDYDGSGVIDEDDVAGFLACMTGPQPSVSFLLPPYECIAVLDFDSDFDVDLHDYARFTQFLSGPAPGDLDEDGDVDADDAAILVECLAGPNVPNPPLACALDDFTASDIDRDEDVDLADFDEFARRAGG